MSGNHPAESLPPEDQSAPEQAPSELDQARARVAAHFAAMPETIKQDIALILSEGVSEASFIERNVRRGLSSSGGAGFGGSSARPTVIGSDRRPTEGVQHLADNITELFKQTDPQSEATQSSEQTSQTPKTLNMGGPKTFGGHS